ncbi:unnamed protein product [Rhizoctonia solani]|uniref:Uncharacterized protein n=2 Tax=Rhizoctonia solani TaxID=456999 RepID=A0A8H3C7C7_9AGAM
MSLRVVGGYLLTYQEAADAAHTFGLSWEPDPELQIGCREAVNEWIHKNAQGYWSNRLQPIAFDESGLSVSRLIFPIVGNTRPAPRGFQYSETKGTPVKFRQDAKAMGLPDEFFKTFVTIHNPEIYFCTPPGYSTRIRLRAE